MLKRILTILVFLSSACILTTHAHAISVKIGYNDTTYDQATASLFKVVFERSGYNVSEIKGDPDVLLSMLDKGEIDVYVSAWLPHRDAASFADAGEDLKLITPLYEDASSFFVVPKYIPKSAMNSIQDLLKPDVMGRMDTSILGDKRSRRLAEQVRIALDDYQLNDQGFTQKLLEQADWYEQVQQKLEDKSWFVLPMTKPHMLNMTKKFRRLKDPKEAFAKDDTAWLVGNSKTHKRIADHIFEIITKMELSTKWVAEIDEMAYDNDWPHYVAARVWMAAHPYTVEYWISGE